MCCLQFCRQYFSYTSVFILPYFTVQPDDAGITNGSSISLTCQAEAFPFPSYEWIQVRGSIRSDLSVGSEVLVFNPLLFGDEGDYVCNVTSAETVISSNTVTLSGKSVFVVHFNEMEVNAVGTTVLLMVFISMRL